MKPVEVKNIRKKYGDIEALRGVSFSAEKGEIFGIIGPDGSGKTSLFRILTTLILADEGDAFVDGFNVVSEYKSVRGIVGYMPGRFSLYQDLTVEENLSLFATVFNTTVEENYHLIENIYKHLEPFKKRRAAALSGGMKQKLALCCALIHKPSVLFLDEPTTGVDPVSRKEFWEMLQKLSNQGITIIVSTPYMDEANLCDRVALILNGKFLKIDTPENIVLAYDRPLISAKCSNMSKLLTEVRKLQEVTTAFAFGDLLHLSLKQSIDTLDELSEKIINLGFKDIQLKWISPSIEDSYILFSENSVSKIKQE